jgi:hypothetical protein
LRNIIDICPAKIKTSNYGNEQKTQYLAGRLVILLMALGAFRYDDIAGWGFGAVGLGFLANAWVFNALKGSF